MNEIFIKIYNMYKDNNLYVEIKRQEFDEICEDLYQKIKSVLDLAPVKMPNALLPTLAGAKIALTLLIPISFNWICALCPTVD